MRHLFILLTVAGVFAADSELANFKTGISLSYSGTRGTDYQEEYFYGVKEQFPRKVVYIRDTTTITMAHNERNVARISGSGYSVTGDDQGLIRMRVDEDLNWYRRWGRSDNTHPEYPGPFTFADLTDRDGNAVVGATGPNGVTLAHTRIAKTTHYWRGHVDAFGDELHTIAFADDDSHLPLPNNGNGNEWCASDGEWTIFVVNPKTPCLTFTPSGTSTFYTTPLKTYFIPKIHTQTTFLTGDNVSIRLDCLYGSNIVLRVNGGGWSTNAEPYTFTSAALSDGTNTLEYWSRSSTNVKTRVVVKNPNYPSAGETHGNFAWGHSESRWQVTSNYMKNSPWYLNKWKTDHSSTYSGRNSIDSGWMTGRRNSWSRYGLRNVLVAKHMANWTAIPTGKSISYAQYAKRTLLESVRTYAAVGHESNHGQTALPCREQVYRGYYDVDTILDNIITYDILINYYRANQVTGGITVIEDYFIRDLLASFCFDELLRDGNYGEVLTGEIGTVDEGGMWDTARKVGAAAIMMCLTDYDTPYYGTSGLGANATGYADLPYPDQTITWKNVWLDNNLTLLGFPNLGKRFGIDEYNISADGHFIDRVSYFDYDKMGHCFGIAANLFLLHHNVRFPRLEAAMMRAAQGTLRSVDFAEGPVRYNMVLPHNSNWYDQALIAINYFYSLSDSSSQSFSKKAIDAQEWMYIFHTPTLENPTPRVATPTITPNGGSFGSAQNVTLACSTAGATIYYTLDGSTPTTASLVYSSPFSVSSTLTVRAFAVADDYDDSAVASAAFTFTTPQVSTPSISPNGGTDDEAFSVTITTATSGATIRYTLNGTDPTSSSTVYSSPLNIASTTTLKARAFKSGETDSAVATATFVVKAQTPTISPNGSESASPVQVTLTSPTANASLYYTLDGTDPDDGDTLYEGPFTISATALLKVIAIKNDIGSSDIASALFTIGSGTGSPEWQNFSITPQGGAFELTFNVSVDEIVNGVFGLSNGAADDYSDLAAIVRFFSDGNVDARNGSAYDAEAEYPYEVTTSYLVRMSVNLATKTYSAWVTPEGGSETQIAADYAFRTEQASVAQLNNFGFISVDGQPISISNISVSAPAGSKSTRIRNFNIQGSFTIRWNE